MLPKNSDYPVGATWQATYHSLQAVVWLESRTPMQGSPADCMEVWKYRVQYNDGSGVRVDWFTTMRGAKAGASSHMFFLMPRGNGRITFTRADI